MIALWMAAALAGTWHLELNAASEAKVPVLGWQRSVTETHALVWIDEDGSWIHKVCTVEIHDKAPLANTVLTVPFIEALPLTRATAALEGDEIRVDLGVARIGYADGPLPLTAEDAAVIDHEGDGRPGATVMLTITGFGTYGVDVVQASHAVLVGRYAEGLYRGEIETLLLEQRVLSADHRMLNSTPALRPNDERSSFTLTPTTAQDCVSLGHTVAAK